MRLLVQTLCVNCDRSRDVFDGLSLQLKSREMERVVRVLICDARRWLFTVKTLTSKGAAVYAER